MERRWTLLGIPSLATVRHIALRVKTNRFNITDLKEEEGPPSPAGLWNRALDRLEHFSGHFNLERAFSALSLRPRPRQTRKHRHSPEHDVKLLEHGSGVATSTRNRRRVLDPTRAMQITAPPETIT